MKIDFTVSAQVYVLIDELGFDQEVPLQISCIAEGEADWIGHTITDVTWDLPQIDHDATPKRLGGLTQRVPEPLATWIREDCRIAEQLRERARIALQEACAHDRALASSLRREA